MKRPFCITVFIMLLVTVAASQKQEMPRRSCHECKVTKNYDRFKDRTQFTLAPMPVADVVEGKMYLSLAAGYKGQTPAGADKAYVIGITFMAKTAMGANDAELIALIDGKPATFGELALADQNSLGYLHVVSYMKLTEIDLIRKIGLADKVEMRFGGIEFQLTRDQRLAILDLLNDLEGVPGSR
ncbi:MAG: hypothetical protein QOG00_237 [Pyrinomonadaceae bacterium]|nr:hypothetical protein [Pyrinomonadaceae bacterium]